MQTTSFWKLIIVSAVTWVVGLASGCGLDVEIEADPELAQVGKPVQLKVDVMFTDQGTAEDAAVLLLLFPGKGGLCEIADEIDPEDFAFGTTSMATIEDRIPPALLAALPEGVTLETLASHLQSAMEQATSETNVATCDQLVDDLDEFDEVEDFAFALFVCLLGDIPSGDTETAMAEYVPQIPGPLTVLAIAAACEEEDAASGAGQGLGDDDDDFLLICNGGIPEYIGFGCTEINVQGGFAAPAMSKVVLLVLTVLLVGVGVLTRRRVRG